MLTALSQDSIAEAPAGLACTPTAFFFFFFLPWLTLKCVFISKSVDGIRLALDGWNSQGSGRMGFTDVQKTLDTVGSEGEEKSDEK